MPRGIRLLDDERQRIIDLLPSGRSCNSIAKELGRSTSTISKYARSIGHIFAQANLARAHEAQAAYGAEWRADFAKRLAAKCDDLLGDMDGRYLVYNFGGKDNDYNEHTLATPPTEAKERLMKSIRLGVQSILDIDRHDSAVGGLADVQEYLLLQKGERPA